MISRTRTQSFIILLLVTLLMTIPPVGLAQDEGKQAQKEEKKEVKSPVPAADPADAGSIDAILGALYDVISGPAGQKRDWDRPFSVSSLLKLST